MSWRGPSTEFGGKELECVRLLFQYCIADIDGQWGSSIGAARLRDATGHSDDPVDYARKTERNRSSPGKMRVADISQKRSRRAEREFGLIVGGVLLLLSLWWLYRGKFPNLRQVTLPLGGLLVLLGLVFPAVLVWPNKAWMALAEGLSFITTRIILAFVFFAIVTPIGFSKRLFGWDPLSRRAPASDSYWAPYSERQKDPRHYEKMF